MIIWLLVVPVLGGSHRRPTEHPAYLMLASPLLVTAMFGFAMLLRANRLKQLLVCIVIAGLSGIASGAVQFDRCPHATYLQLFGMSIPIIGDKCGNARPITPWWFRG